MLRIQMWYFKVYFLRLINRNLGYETIVCGGIFSEFKFMVLPTIIINKHLNIAFKEIGYGVTAWVA